MITLPGNLTSPRAGPILCRCAPAIVKAGRRGIVDFVAVDANEHRPGTWARFLYDDDGEERGGYVWGADPLPEPRPLDVIRLAAIGLDLTADLGPTIALRWLGRHYGIDVGIGCPAWVYSAATRDSVTSWSLIGVDGKRYVFCDYPPDIEATNGPPIDRETYANLRNLPTNPLEALVAACLHAAGVPRE